uniref:Macro domain-containing protein n=1 Tax=Sphaeramia orbicularis TaxID=375764 RepID=A0A673C9Y5_9TELE
MESPKAAEDLNTRLSSLACSAQLYPEDKKVLVRRLDQLQSSLSSLTLSEKDTVVASYWIRGGLQVLVCLGDITKQEADALVNAANEELDHCGGVAAALSQAGGPEVQRESHDLVKCLGTIPVGSAVLTTGGNLHCKKMLHAVGPVKGKVGGKETVLIEKAVRSALNLCEMMDFQSVAMPCISSGSFGVPVSDCTKAIVTAVKKFGSLGGGSLSRVTLIDNRVEVVKSLKTKKKTADFSLTHYRDYGPGQASNRVRKHCAAILSKISLWQLLQCRLDHTSLN